MLFKGTMSVVTDLNILGTEINNMDFMSVAAVTNTDYLNHPNIYNASILMPPTEILMAWADGNELVLQSEYPKYLLQKDPDDMIVALLAAMTKRNIVLYIPKDEFNIFGMMLLNHLYYYYGIVCNFGNTQYMFAEYKLPFIISKFYMMNLMEPMDYINSYPTNLLLPEFVINKLAVELKPFNHQATFAEYADYFNGLVRANTTGGKIQMIKLRETPVK